MRALNSGKFEVGEGGIVDNCRSEGGPPDILSRPRLEQAVHLSLGVVAVRTAAAAAVACKVG